MVRVLFELVWALWGVGTQFAQDSRSAAAAARQRAAERLKRWAREKARVPEPLRMAAARVRQAGQVVGRVVGRVAPTVVAGWERGVAEGRERHREWRELRTVARESGRDSRAARQVQSRHVLERSARRTGGQVPWAELDDEVEASPDRPVTPVTVEGEVVSDEAAPAGAQVLNETPPTDRRGSPAAEGQWDRCQHRSPSGRACDRQAEWRTRPQGGSQRYCAEHADDMDGIQPAPNSQAAVPAQDRPGVAGLVSEVHTVDDLRRLYQGVQSQAGELTDAIQAARGRLDQAQGVFEQASAHVSTERFAPAVISEVADMQDQLQSAAQALRDALAAMEVAQATAAGGLRSLEQYRVMEEAVQSGPAAPVHTAVLAAQ